MENSLSRSVFRYYVAIAQRPNRLKVLGSPLNLSLNGDFYYGRFTPHFATRQTH